MDEPTTSNSDFTRRAHLLGIAGAAMLGGGATRPPKARPLASKAADSIDRIEPYAAAREEALFPRPKPFTAVFSKGGRTVAFAAVVHTADPASATFREITQAFDKIAPRLLIVEGFPTILGDDVPRIVAQASETDPAKRTSYAQGEAGHALRLATRRSIPFRGGGITDTTQALELSRQGFGGDDVIFSSLLGPLAQDFRAKVFEGPSDPRFAGAYLRWSRSAAAGSQGARYRDPAAFRAWYLKAFGQPLDNDPDWYRRGDPGDTHVAGRIGAALGLIRDRHLYRVIRQASHETSRLVVVFGGSHLASLWPALSADYGPPILLPAA